MKKHKAAGIVPYIVEDDPYHPKVLLIKSDLGWEFPKGRVESNETTLTAAIRETKEETGLSDLKIHHRFDLQYVNTLQDWIANLKQASPFLLSLMNLI